MRTDADLRNILIEETTPDGLISQCIVTDESLPTTASKFAIGCILTSSANGKTYRNAGTVAVPSWNDIGASAASEISLANGKVLIGAATGLAAEQTISGDITITNAGVATLKTAFTGNSGREYYVDGSRTDTYTATGSILYPFKTIAAAIAVINADSTAQQAIGPAEYALNARYILNVAPGLYSDNLTIGNVKYLRVNLNGAAISGNIAYDTTMVGGTADQYYSKLEFFGGYGVRAEKGNSGRITGTFTGTRNNDSLTYVSFTGIDLAGNVKFTTQGTWVVHLHNSRVGAFFEGSALNGGQVLLETTGWNEFTSAGHIANSADGSATTVAIYNGSNTEFDLINITPLAESRFFNCRFKSDVTVTAQSLYLDANSYKSLLAQTETLTGATVVLMDSYLPAAAAQNEVTTTGAISVANYLTTIDTSAGATAYTLAAGSAIGQRKKILMRVDNGDATITGAFAGTANTLTFANAGEFALLEWNGTDWIALELGSYLNMAHVPTITTV